jgi:hypothetical protein
MMNNKANPTTKPKVLKGAAAVKQYQKEVSPQGVAAAEAAAKAALEAKYPGLYITKTRTYAGIGKR